MMLALLVLSPVHLLILTLWIQLVATVVFAGTERTAASAGNIVSQSVRFDASYTLGSVAGYDLSQGAGSVEAELAYTIFIP